MKVDVLLSSGFLCFSSHCGFLRALESSDLEPQAYVGVSSGSLAAAFSAAGMDASEIEQQLGGQRPISLVRPSMTPWNGPLSSRALLRRLRDVLPPTFEDLALPLAVGVYTKDAVSGSRQPILVVSGDLPAAVAASCAVPGMFGPIALEGTGYASGDQATAIAGARCLDGGAVDRTSCRGWSRWRPNAAGVLHLVSDLPSGEHGPRDCVDAGSNSLLGVVRTPRARASFFSLRDFDAQVEAAAQQATTQLAQLRIA